MAPVLMLYLGAQRKKAPVSRVHSKTPAARAPSPVPAPCWRARSLSPSWSPSGSWPQRRPPPGARPCRRPTTAMTTPSSSRGPGIEEALGTGEAIRISAWQNASCLFFFLFSFLVYFFELKIKKLISLKLFFELDG